MSIGCVYFMTTALSFVALFALLVTLHEWGHFIVAKLSGIFVREFSIGIGPKLFETTNKGTKYVLRVIPFGGYVRMASSRDIQSFGEEGRRLYLTETVDGVTEISNLENPMARPVVMHEWSDDLTTLKVYDADTTEPEDVKLADEVWYVNAEGEREKLARNHEWIESAAVWKRVLTFLAGPVMNIVLAFSLFTGVNLMVGAPAEEAIIGTIDEDMPIAQTSIQPGDEIIAIDGEPVELFSEVGEFTKGRGGDSLSVTLLRDGEEFTEDVAVVHENGRDLIGIRVYVEKGLGQAISSGISITSEVVRTTLAGVAQLFSNFSLSSLGGPVYMAQATGEVTATAESTSELIVVLMSWGAMLSVNLAIVNMLPIPALDGGRILLALIEGIRRKALSEDLEMKINLVGGLLIIGLALVVTLNDIFSL